MKNKKLFLIVALLSTMCLVLVGCSNPFSKSEEVAQEGSFQDNFYITGTGTYAQNEVVNVMDIVGVDESVKPNVTRCIGVLADGTETDVVPTNELGSFQLNIVVETNMEEGNWNGTYEYVVSGPELNVPDSIKSNIEGFNWSVQELDCVSEEPTKVSYATSLVNVRPNELYSTDNEDSWSVKLLTLNEETVLVENEQSPLQSPLFSIAANELYVSSMEADLKEKLSWLATFFDESFSVKTTDTEYCLYSTDGTSYPIKEVTVYYNNNTSDAAPQLFYIDYKENVKMILTYNMTSTMSLVKDNSNTSKKIKSYDKFKNNLIEKFSKSVVFDKANILKTYGALQDLTDCFVIGEVEGAGPIGENEVNVDDTSEEVSTSEEYAVMPKEGEYYRKYSSDECNIFCWPEDPSGNIYSRWIYEILNDTNFSNSIWLGKEKNYIYSDTNSSDEDWKMDTGSKDDTTNDNNTVTDSHNTVQLLSSYSTYLVSDEQLDVILDTAKSKSTCAYLSSGDNTFYIETSRASTIRNYISTCLYPTNSFDGDYTIEEDTVNSKITKYGDITGYTISYTDSSGNQQKKGYMAVYNISNDYLCIYGDNMTEDAGVLVDILEKSISQ